MKCSNCGAAFSVGAETLLLNCAFCGAVQRNAEAAEPRPVDALLDKVFAETGDASSSPRVEATVPAGSRNVEVMDEALKVERLGRATATKTDFAKARRETSRVLDSVFGDGDLPVATTTARVTHVDDIQADPAPDARAETAATRPVSSPLYDVPNTEQRRSRPQITLGGAQDNPDWTRYLVPVLLLALLGGLGVAGLMAVLLG